jgi:hypothetical protein
MFTTSKFGGVQYSRQQPALFARLFPGRERNVPAPARSGFRSLNVMLLDAGKSAGRVSGDQIDTKSDKAPNLRPLATSTSGLGLRVRVGGLNLRPAVRRWQAGVGRVGGYYRIVVCTVPASKLGRTRRSGKVTLSLWRSGTPAARCHSAHHRDCRCHWVTGDQRYTRRRPHHWQL